MTVGKSLALAMGFVVAMALGVWVSPFMREHAPFDRDHKTAAHEVAPAKASAPPAAARPTGSTARSTSRDAVPAVALSTPGSSVSLASVSS